METIFDVGEIGWSLYHRAHLTWRREQGESPPDVQVWTLPDRLKLYEGEICNICRTDLPASMISPFLFRNSFLYDGGPPIEGVLQECGIDTSTLIHGWRGYDWKNVNCYAEKMIFEPIPVRKDEMEKYEAFKTMALSEEDTHKQKILLLPRYKFGAKYTEKRNWGKERWNELVTLLEEHLPDYSLIVGGKFGQVYQLDMPSSSLHLVNDDPLVPMLCALEDPQTVLAVSSQSFLGKLALLQNVDTIMWGHEKDRHQVYENWSTDTRVKCNFIEDMNYEVSPQSVFETIRGML